MERKMITDYLKAGYSHFYVTTEEMERAIDLLRKEITENAQSIFNEEVPNGGWPIETWSLGPDKCKGCGYVIPSGDFESCPECGGTEIVGCSDAMQPLLGLAGASKNTTLILKNFHWFLKDEQSGISNYPMTQYIQDNLDVYRLKQKRKILVIMAPVPAGVGLPKELVREFIPLKFGLPNEEEVGEVLDYAISVAEKNPKFKKPSDEDKNRIVQASKGMTKQEIENSLFLSLVKTGGRLDPAVVTDRKVAYLEEVAGVKYIEYKETFDSLLGYGGAKKLALSLMTDPRSKGFILLGPSGTGKSHFCKALSGELGIPMFTVEMAEWFTSGYGETGQRVIRFLDSVVAVGECLLFFDE